MPIIQNKLASVKISKNIDRFQQFVKSLYKERLDKIILFGSQARGEASFDSDIDILIVTHQRLSKQEREKLINFVSDLSINDDLLLNFIEMSPQKFQSENSPLLLNIRREGIVL